MYTSELDVNCLNKLFELGHTREERKDDVTARFGDALDNCTKRRVVGDYTGWGVPRFIIHLKLSPKYLVNDSLLQCLKLTLLHMTKLWLGSF